MKTLPRGRHDPHPPEWWRERLDGWRREGESFKAVCPAHADAKGSLHITPKGSGSLVFCFAGCAYRDVLALVEGADPKPHNGKDPKALTSTPGTLRDPRDWAAEYTGTTREHIDSLPIRADGQDLCFTFSNGIEKRRTAGTKQITWAPQDAFSPPLWPEPPDRLPPTIVLTEGETDCIVLRFCGIEAYALTKGAERPLTPRQIDALAMRGVEAVIVAFDADEAGRDGSDKQTAQIIAAGLEAATICPPDYDPLTGSGKDWRAWHLAGGKELPAPTSADDLFLAPADVDDLLANPPDALIDGWFHRGALTLIVGGPKDGKTSLAFGMLAACLHGHLFADIAPQQTPGPVLVSEEGYVTLGEKVRRYGLADYRLLTQAQNPGLPFPEVMAQAARLAEREDRPLLIDTLRAWGGIVNEGDASEVGMVLDTIRKAVIPRGVACVVIHQTNRAGQYRGSTEMLAQVETMIEVSRDDTDQHGDEARTCRITSRFEGAADPIVLIRDGAIYRNAGAPKLVVGKASSRMAKRRREMREALEAEPRTKQWLMETFGISLDTCDADLQAIGAVGRRIGAAHEGKVWSVGESVGESVTATPQPEAATTPVVGGRETATHVSPQPPTTGSVGAKATKKGRMLK